VKAAAATVRRARRSRHAQPPTGLPSKGSGSGDRELPVTIDQPE